MNIYKIIVSKRESIYEEYLYNAVFEDYDGAPIDHETPSNCPIGYGNTEYDAMADLTEKAAGW